METNPHPPVISAGWLTPKPKKQKRLDALYIGGTCRHGHALTGENVILTKDQRVRCKTCQRGWEKVSEERRRERRHGDRSARSYVKRRADDGTFRCRACKQYKQLEAFTIRGYYADGSPEPHAECKPCRSKEEHRRWQKRRAREKEAQRPIREHEERDRDEALAWFVRQVEDERRRGVSVTRIAERLGLSPSTLNHWRYGTARPSPALLKQVIDRWLGATP